MKSFIDLVIKLEKYARRLNGKNTIYFTHNVTSVDDIRRTLSATRYWNMNSESGELNIQYALTSVDPSDNKEAFTYYCKSMKMSELTDTRGLSDICDSEYCRVILALS